MKYKMFSILLFALAYLFMLFANNETFSEILKYPPIVAALMSILISGAEETFTIYSCFMFFSYPQVNFGALLVIALALIIEKKKVYIIERKVTIIIAVLSIWIFIDTAINQVPGNSWNDWISWMYILVIVVVCQNLGGDAPYNTLKGLQMAGVLLVLLQIVVMLFPQLGNLMTDINAIRIPDINFRAVVYASCILLTEHLLKKGYTKKISGIIYIALFIFGVFALGTRGIMAILIIYFGMRYVLTGEPSLSGLMKKMLIAIIVVVSGLFFLKTEAANGIIRNLQSISSTTVHSNAVRIKLYQDIITKMIPNNFVKGVGPGNFQISYHRYASIPFNASHAHNIYLQIFSEDGIIGFVLVIALIVVLTSRVIKGLTDRQATYIRTCAYINFFYLAYGLVENVWGDSRILGFFIIVNILFAVISLKEKENVGSYVYNK